MISSLTLEQEALIPKVRDYWFNLVTNNPKRADIAELKDDIDWLYNLVGKKPPKFCLIFDSYNTTRLAPIIFHELSEKLKFPESANGSRLESQLSSQLSSQLWSRLQSQLGSRLQSQLESRLWSQLGSRLQSQLWSQLDSTTWCFGLCVDSPWMSFYDYAFVSGLLGDSEQREQFDRYASFLKKGVWDMTLRENCIVICRCPTKVSFDENGRLHSITGGAIQWADYIDNHFIHGVFFANKDLWKKIVTREISAKEAIGLSNVEQRTIACQTLGYDSVIAELNAKVIDKSTKRSLHYLLYKVDLGDDRRGAAKFVKVECPSTGRETLLRVNPSINKAETAVAQTFRMEPEEYWRSLKAET